MAVYKAIDILKLLDAIPASHKRLLRPPCYSAPLMTNQTIPSWGDDLLSTWLSNAQDNERITSLNMPDLYTLVQHVDAVLQRVMDITEKEHTEALLPSRMLIARARGAWLAAMRLAMSGQTVEAYPLVRAVIENAWYALHIAKDPAPPTRATIWLNRRQDKAATDRCRAEFSTGNVRMTHEALDARNAAAMLQLYERVIDLGAHPNQLGVLGSVTRTETDDAYTFHVDFLTNKPLLIALAVKSAVEASVGALRTFRLIFPERFEFADVNVAIEKLVAEHNTIAGRYFTREAAQA